MAIASVTSVPSVLSLNETAGCKTDFDVSGLARDSWSTILQELIVKVSKLVGSITFRI